MLTGSLINFPGESMAKLRANPKLFTASYLKKDKLFKFNTIEHDNTKPDEPVALDDVIIINNLWYCMTWRYKTLSKISLFDMKHTKYQMQKIMMEENNKLQSTVLKLQKELQVSFFCVRFCVCLMFCCRMFVFLLHFFLFVFFFIFLVFLVFVFIF